MIFVGDIALPHAGAINYDSVLNDLPKKKWFGNLEGALVEDCNGLLEKPVVFNSHEAIVELTRDFEFVGFSMANNHISDVASIKQTEKHLDALGIGYAGGGVDLKKASEPLVIYENGIKIAIICFGWSAIQCKVAGVRSMGVNPYSPDNVKASVGRVKMEHPDARVICYMHWNYELEKYPQPLDRSLAHALIDEGVFAIIGCHSHRVQPIEIYKGKPIVYGLGNFMFSQGMYFNGKVVYPNYCSDQYAFELNFTNDSFKNHRLKYNKKIESISLVNSVSVSCFNGGEFAGFSDQDYEMYFNKNRIQKKYLPIFKYKDSRLVYKLKLGWVKVRDFLIYFLVKAKLK